MSPQNDHPDMTSDERYAAAEWPPGLPRLTPPTHGELRDAVRDLTTELAAQQRRRDALERERDRWRKVADTRGGSVETQRQALAHAYAERDEASALSHEWRNRAEAAGRRADDLRQQVDGQARYLEKVQGELDEFKAANTEARMAWQTADRERAQAERERDALQRLVDAQQEAEAPDGERITWGTVYRLRRQRDALRNTVATLLGAMDDVIVDEPDGWDHDAAMERVRTSTEVPGPARGYPAGHPLSLD